MRKFFSDSFQTCSFIGRHLDLMVEISCSVTLEVIFTRKANERSFQVVVVPNNLRERFWCDLCGLALDEKQRDNILASFAIADDVKATRCTFEFYLRAH